MKKNLFFDPKLFEEIRFLIIYLKSKFFSTNKTNASFEVFQFRISVFVGQKSCESGQLLKMTETKNNF